MSSFRSAPPVACVALVFAFFGAVLEISAADLLINATTTVLFSALDGSPYDEDAAVDGIVTLSSLTVTGSGRIVVDVATVGFNVAGGVMLDGTGTIGPDPNALPVTGSTITIVPDGSVLMAGTTKLFADGIDAGGAQHM